ncbi:MAG: thiol-disulfide isomerase [Bryobacteraceae bacterium]
MKIVVCALATAALAAAASVPAQVTFDKDVLPVLQKNCQSCHRPGEAAPMSFLTYQQTRPWAKAIKAAVVSKKMPPWFADPHYGKFANDRTLSPAEIETLTAWVDTGAKEGNSKDAPKPVSFVDGWQIGKPDAVIEMPIAFDIPASGTIDYQYILVPTGFTEDKWVQAAEARPGNKELVHHIIAFIREPGNPWMKDAKPGVPFVPKRDGGAGGRGGGFGDSLAGYAPGMVAPVLEPGQGKLVKAGSGIILQMHYTATGKPGTDRSRVGVIFAKQPPKERVVTLAATTTDFAIPAGDPNYEVDSKVTLQHDATLVSLLPHMHFRGKSFEYTAIYPNGEKEVLLDVPHYDFNWQLTYYLDKQKTLPAGTRIECVAHYDNSPNNRFNPDPTKVVRFGEQTWEEMMFGFFDVAVPVDVTMMDLMRPKKPATKQSGAGL